jgi:hypothetical protein
MKFKIKSQNPTVKSFYIILILLSVVESSVGLKGGSAPPKIGISRWMTIEASRDARYTWEDGSLTPLLLSGALSIRRSGEETTFIVSQHIERLQIVCNATYPVSWVSPESEVRPLSSP